MSHTRLSLVCGGRAAWILILPSLAAFGQDTAVRFEKLVLTDRYYCDGITTGDINGDGRTDVVAGPFWYPGPTFSDPVPFYDQQPLPTAPSPSNSMFSFVHDFSNDGRPDILVLGRVHKHTAVWYENPGGTRPAWPKHFVFERVRGESPLLLDLFADQTPQLATHWEGRWGTLTPNPVAPGKPWTFRAIGSQGDWNQFYHGQGFGDLNGDGRTDVILNDGWFEQPEKPEAVWTFHRGRFSRGRGGAQMFVYDVDGDGDQDVITALDAHGWGLAWFEQVSADYPTSDGLRVIGSTRFVEHRFMGDRTEEQKYGAAFSQPHALALADIDGDGLQDIVTGKRRWAHGPTGDLEPAAAPVVYWFRLSRTDDGKVRYTPHLIDSRSGVGVQICARDVNGDGRTDVLTASKLGAFVFLNRPE